MIGVTVNRVFLIGFTMHIAGKVFLGLGAVTLVIGMVMAGMGGNTLEDAGEVDVEKHSLWNGQDGVWYYDGWDEIMIFVSDEIRCDEFTVTITNETNDDVYRADECTSDGSKPMGHEDDPSGWYHMGWIGGEQKPGDMEIDASHEIHLLPIGVVLGEVLTEGAAGFLGIVGGIGLSGCGVCFLLLGGILALVLKDPKEATQIQQYSKD